MEAWLLTVQSLLGLAGLIGIAWALSEDRSKVDWRLAGAAVAVQIGLAFLMLRVPMIREAMLSLNGAVEVLRASTEQGQVFVFGYLGGGPQPFVPASEEVQMMILAFQILPLVIVVSALSALLYHWRILPVITKGFAWALRRSLGIGGAAGLGAAANVFMGMIEAPLFVRAYLARMSRAELFILMTTGLATVAGTVLVFYATILEAKVPGAAGHILTASIISLPAAVLMAQMMIPGNKATDTGPAETGLQYAGSMDAVVQGTQEGLKIFLTVMAMLLVVVAFVALADRILALLPEIAGAPLTLERLLGWAFAPLVWLFGVPWSEAGEAGALMGTKTILNELLAYLNLVAMPEGTLSPRTALIMVYAMCGFANLGSVGILISGLTALVPERRAEIAGLGLKALVAGTLATGMTGAIAGLLAA